MLDMTPTIFLWLKALHLIAVIAWMAGMLYLPRLFVYHCDAPPGSPQSETFKVMERRLLRGIINPAMVAALLFGIALLVGLPLDAWPAWLWAKLVLVLGLIALHGMLARWRKDFEADANRRPARFYRIMNEVPTVLMIGIVILVVVKPF
jgi:protoporphyrinogen IX oxidase